MERDKETKKDLEETVVELQKSNNVMKGLLIVLVVVILVSACFGIGFIAGEKLAEKDNDIIEEEKDKEETRDEEPEKEENKETEKEEVDNTISADLRKDLDKKVELTARYIGTGLYGSKNQNIQNVISDNVEEDYPYFAYATYQYYIYKTGKTIQKWSTNDRSYGPCYKDGQNGYCYPMDKADVLKYEKELYNMGVKIFDLGEGYSIVKGNKVYVTSVPWNGSLEVKLKNVVSVEKNDDVIEYIANYVVGDYVPNESSNVNMTLKYIFKINEDGNFYLHSFEKM